MQTSALPRDDFKSFYYVHVSKGNESRQKMEETDGKRRNRFLSARGDLFAFNALN